MKVIPENVSCSLKIRFHLYHWVNTSISELLVHKGIIHTVVNVSALTLFIRYTRAVRKVRGLSL
jgi:hypothetical protein